MRLCQSLLKMKIKDNSGIGKKFIVCDNLTIITAQMYRMISMIQMKFFCNCFYVY